MNAVALVAPENPADIERLREALRQMAAIGGNPAWLASLLAPKVGVLLETQRQRRDRAIVQLARTCAGETPWAVARDVQRVLRRYANTAWRRDRNLTSPPLAYAVDPQRQALFAVMQADEAACDLSQKQISRVLESSHCFDNTLLGHQKPVQMSIASAHDDGHRNRKVNRMLAKPDLPDAKFIGALKAAPIGQKIIEDDHVSTVAQRSKLLAELKALDAAAEIEFPKLEKALSAKIADVRVAETALRAAQEKHNAALYEKSGAHFKYTATRQRIESSLRDSPASDAIDEFQHDMISEIDATRKMHDFGYVHEKNPVTGRTRTLGYNKKVSLNARLNAIKMAIEAAEDLRIAADQSDVVAKLKALRDSLPEVAPATPPSANGRA